MKLSPADERDEVSDSVGSFTHLKSIVTVLGWGMRKQEYGMKKRAGQLSDQPTPFTPGVTKAMVREHAISLYRDRLAHDGHLRLEDWVLAEKDLVSGLETQGLLTRQQVC